VATEAATNLAKHATGGQVVLRSLAPEDAGCGVEVLALDRGPGIADVGRSLRDGYSTAGTAGAGLGAIRRLADLFDLATAPGLGTALVARVCRRDVPDAAPPQAVEVGAVCLPVAGEEACGDAWAVESSPTRTAVLVADGLGHGLLAATAAAEAVRVFRKTAGSHPEEIVRALHAALRPTRGAAAAVAVIDHPARTLRYAGVGNISGVVLALGRRQGLVSHSGTLGHDARKVQSFEYVWPAGALLVMHSDGLASQWDLGRYPGLSARHPALAAGVLYRDYRRDRDDVGVVCLREAGGTP
jgi:hypothetical protein